MKKTIIILLLAVFTLPALAGDPPDVKPSKITTLVINANITVRLMSNSNALLHVEGSRSMSKSVEVIRMGDTLMIKASRSKDLIDAGVIYVSANQLKTIRVNSNARVYTMSTLQVPQLNVFINGNCEFDIHNAGEVKLMCSNEYDLEQTRRIRKIPSTVSFVEKF